MKTSSAILIVIATLWLPFTCKGQETSAEQVAFFESKIRPVLVRECYGCHSDRTGKIRGGLRLDTRQLILLGGDSGASIVPGKPDESILYTAMLHDGLVMPPKRRLPDRVLEDFKTWIEMGAPDPRKTVSTPVKATVSKADIKRARESFWSYLPVKHSTPPKLEQDDWAKQTSIVSFRQNWNRPISSLPVTMKRIESCVVSVSIFSAYRHHSNRSMHLRLHGGKIPMRQLRPLLKNI